MVKIPKKIRDFAKGFGVTYVLDENTNRDIVAAYIVGTGTVVVNRKARVNKMDIPFILLHELGHAIIDFFPIDITDKAEEIKANGIALAFATILKIPIRYELLDSIGEFTRVKGLRLPRPKN